jgi:hypothetical protein
MYSVCSQGSPGRLIFHLEEEHGSFSFLRNTAKCCFAKLTLFSVRLELRFVCTAIGKCEPHSQHSPGGYLKHRDGFLAKIHFNDQPAVMQVFYHILWLGTSELSVQKKIGRTISPTVLDVLIGDNKHSLIIIRVVQKAIIFCFDDLSDDLLLIHFRTPVIVRKPVLVDGLIFKSDRGE